jgi:acetyl-CoA carboxylase carboxyltransferase component
MPPENDTDRDDLAELQRRRELTEDAARSEAVSKRHDRGGRTARENVTDLIDEGSWVEYGRYAIAQQRTRRSREDLIANTPADGLVAGTAAIDGEPIAVLAYDYTVLAGTQGTAGHFKKDRMWRRPAAARRPRRGVPPRTIPCRGLPSAGPYARPSPQSSEAREGPLTFR